MSFIHIVKNRVCASAQNILLRLCSPHHLKTHKYQPFSSSVISVLDSCRSLQSLKQIHASITVSYGQERVFTVASKLASLYIQFNDFGSSVSVLRTMKEPSTFIWNSVVKAHVNSGFIEKAFFIYKLMRKMGVPCDGYTFPILCRLVVSLDCGVGFTEMIHCVAMQMGFESNVYFCNTAIGAYVKSGCFSNALKVFEEMTNRDLVSWTSMISGYVCEGNASGAFVLYNEMRKEVEPNEVTLIVMLQICSNVVQGRQFHGHVIKYGSITDQSLKNSILKMYTDFGSTDDSETLFEETASRDVVFWNIMIYLYSSKGNTMKIVEQLNKLRGEVEPSIETLTLLISGLGELGNHSQIRQIHCLALKGGFFDDILISSLLDSYTKSGDFENSTTLFREISQKNYTPCHAMISENMTSLVITCMHMSALRMGKSVHAYYVRNLFSVSLLDEGSRSLETSILNMYVRCGDISSARICFDTMHVKDIVAWSSMIEGCGTHGLGYEALEIFHRMKSEGIEPNSVTFLSLLSSCSHSGLLHESCKALYSMKWDFGIGPDLDHYTCLVDLLGRLGKIKEALSVVMKLVVFPDSKIWASLLSAARIHGDRRVGEFAAEKILELEMDNAGYYTLLSNVRASEERWNEVREIRSGMKEINVIKHPGWSCLEVKGVFHGFVSGDRSHHLRDEVYTVVECLSRNAFDVGNVLYL